MTIVEQLKRDEGCRAVPYKDSRGIWTVGYGHNLTVGGLSSAAMEQILRDDLFNVETELLVFPVYHRLSKPRQGVLLNMGFNLGVAGLAGFRQMFEALEVGDYDAAATHMLDSQWAKQVGTRATRLATQMRTDVWT